MALLPNRPLSANLPVLPKISLIEATELAGKDAGPVTDVNGNEIPPYDTVYHFDQLIDHRDPSKGTFKTRYWATWEHYKPGGPIILMTPGEGNADGTPQPCSTLVNQGTMTPIFRLLALPHQSKCDR